MVICVPRAFKGCTAKSFVIPDVAYRDPGFVIHPPTSVLAEQLQVDPQSLNNENYSGIYDESGDYVPQYCDDPEKIPQGGLSANTENGVAPPSVERETVTNSEVNNDITSDTE